MLARRLESDSASSIAQARVIEVGASRGWGELFVRAHAKR